MFAKVIVDVPARETNRPYDYQVPDSLKTWVAIGSRVAVSFGSRTLQGIVVGLSTNSDTDVEKIKPIQQVLDTVPPLTEELVELAKWMSETYICHELSALQAMLPSALKAKYEKILVPADQHIGAYNEGQLDAKLSEAESQWLKILIEKGSMTLAEAQRHFAGQESVILSLLHKGYITEIQNVRDRLSVKRTLYVRPALSTEELQRMASTCSVQAKRQKQVLEYFIQNPDSITKKQLLEHLGISSSTIQTMVTKGWLKLEQRETYRDPYDSRKFTRTKALPLTKQQGEAIAPIIKNLKAKRHQAYLLHGVTGSGKTEVYLQAIETCLAEGRAAIVLVPEISLTPQMVHRFKGRFGDQVAVMHSRLSQGERYDEWRKIATGKAQVAIGARSAVFAPFRKLGLIIMDEEHESSYKQEESPKYHAKEVALERGRKNDAVVILGSATPSLETYHQTQTGEITLLTMTSRVADRPLPPVHLVDMRDELKLGNRSMFSRKLHHAISERLKRKEQTVLLLNRRGYSTFVMCRSCGYTMGCPHCEISLTYHRHTNMLRCHYCGYAEREVKTCPSCDSEYIRYFGTGTQRVEEELVKHFPGIRVIRMDVDTTREKGAHEKWLSRFGNKEADVLLGTQMVAKGLDFPNVTLVGVIAADTMLNLPDFRSAERTFQLLTQVAGRAGRHELPGEVIVQTYNPTHYSINMASQHDYSSFVERELHARQIRQYPPFCRLILVTFQHEQLPVLLKLGEQFAQELRRKLERELSACETPSVFGEVLGPVASPIPRIKDRYRFQCVIKYSDELQAVKCVRETMEHFREEARKYKLQIQVDVGPQMLM